MIQEVHQPFQLQPGDEELITLKELCVLLRNRNIIKRSDSAIRMYATQGIKHRGSRLKLRTVKVANVMHSKIEWFCEFLVEQQ